MGINPAPTVGEGFMPSRNIHLERNPVSQPKLPFEQSKRFAYGNSINTVPPLRDGYCAMPAFCRFYCRIYFHFYCRFYCRLARRNSSL